MTRAENEELKCRNQNLTSDLTSAKAEIERLTAERDMLKGWERLIKAESHAPIIKKAKTEAYKEFAERLKGLFCQYADYDAMCIYEVIDRIDIALEEAEAALKERERG